MGVAWNCTLYCNISASLTSKKIVNWKPKTEWIKKIFKIRTATVYQFHNKWRFLILHTSFSDYLLKNQMKPNTNELFYMHLTMWIALERKNLKKENHDDGGTRK